MDATEQRRRMTELAALKMMPEDTRQRVAEVIEKVAKMNVLTDGEAMLHEGYLGYQTGYILVEGEAEVEREGTGLVRVSAPAMFGEMSQFNPRVQRTATVRAKGPACVLAFSWEKLYDQAQKDLAAEEQTMLMDGIERIILERFHREDLIELELFAGLSDHLRLRVGLILLWFTRRIEMKPGQILFKENSQCSGQGYLLVKGSVELRRKDQPSQMVAAPDILGVIPKLQTSLLWSATAVALGDAEVLRFYWPAFTAMLRQRLNEDELRQAGDSIKAYTQTHFWH